MSSTPPSSSSSSKSFWQRRWVRFLLWSAVTLVTLVFLFYAGINWYGARQWQQTLAMLEREKVTVKFRDLLPDPVPDAENFCAIPPLDGIAQTVDNDGEKGEPGEKRRALKVLSFKKEGNSEKSPILASGPSLGKAASMKEWADHLNSSTTAPDDSAAAARLVLQSMAPQEPLIAELAAALPRSLAQWTPAWKTQELPAMLYAISVSHFSILNSVPAGMALRAVAAARAGEVAKAHEAVLIATRFNQATTGEPFLIGVLVAISQSASVHHAVWELCHAHAGSAADFRALQAQLEKIDIEKAAVQGWQCEVTAAVGSLQELKNPKSETRTEILHAYGNRERSTAVLMSVIPPGWVDMNVANIARLQYQYLVKPAREGSWQTMAATADELNGILIDAKTHIFTQPGMVMAALAIPAMGGVSPKVAHTQCVLNQAIIACALEAYYAEHKEYPQNLDALQRTDGGPLPGDIVNKRPMSYRKTDDGRYALWASGFDGKDDGGVRQLDPKNPTKTKFNEFTYKGDWVWDFGSPSK